ncbi:UNVERIFIED_CONTAM: hypothetical protein HDU68_012512 [Siphonaria sp. JEL0065]|nr:hypothetical protein HDU68_012512 [Siphonaria sp. JEL0065]
MEKVLSFLKPKYDAAVLSACIDAIEAILVDSSEMHRLFEGLGGLPLISALIQSRNSELKKVKLRLLKAVELLILYLSPESNYPDLKSSQLHYMSPESKQQFIAKLLGAPFVEKLLTTIEAVERGGDEDGSMSRVSHPDIPVAAEESRNRVEYQHSKYKKHNSQKDIVSQVHQLNVIRQAGEGGMGGSDGPKQSKKLVVIGNGPRGPKRQE